MSRMGELEMINVGIMLTRHEPELRTFDKLSEITDYVNDTYGIKIERGMPHEHIYNEIKKAIKEYGQKVTKDKL